MNILRVCPSHLIITSASKVARGALYWFDAYEPATITECRNPQGAATPLGEPLPESWYDVNEFGIRFFKQTIAEAHSNCRNADFFVCVMGMAYAHSLLM